MNFWEQDGKRNYDNKAGGNNAQNQSGFSREIKNDSVGAGANNANAFGSPNPQNLEEQLRRYSTMNEQQLLAELLRSAGGMKANGSLTADELENFYSRAAAFMSTEQLTKLRTLINMLK